MKRNEFTIGMRVTHPDYGDGTVTEIYNISFRQPIKFNWDNGCEMTWPLDYDRCTPIEPEYKFGEAVEMTDAGEWPTVPAKGWYGLLDPDGGGHWITNGSIMQRWKHVRRPVKPEPLTPREEFEKATKCRSHDDIMKAGDRYVKRTLAEARETWEKDNPRLIWPTVNDIIQASKPSYSLSLKWLATPAGQQWLKERKEGGK